jgi:15-cis-phytoene synthase
VKELFDDISFACSRIITRRYSSSFSLGIKFLANHLRDPIYAIYGFVRCADEIVDSFHDYDKKNLLATFRDQTTQAIQQRISVNPILNGFQAVVNRYKIKHEWIDMFLDSMEMDLHPQKYNEEKFRKYILGSAEVVGLMCLHVFTEGNEQMFEKLKPYAMRLGAAFQKVNFLRDANMDNIELGRSYFPGIDLENFSEAEKKKIEIEIESDFDVALNGIRMLPHSSRNGVYLAYFYYSRLLRKIKKMPAKNVMNERVRIPDFQKLILMFQSNFLYQINRY